MNALQCAFGIAVTLLSIAPLAAQSAAVEITSDVVFQSPDGKKVIRDFEKLNAELAGPFVDAFDEQSKTRICAAAQTAVEQYLNVMSKAGAELLSQTGSERDTLHVIVHVYAATSGKDKAPDGCWFVARQNSDAKFSVSTTPRIYGSTNVVVAAIVVDYPALEGLSYWALVKPKLPTNLQNALAALRLFGIKFLKASPEDRVYHGFGRITDVSVPSYIAVTPAALLTPEGTNNQPTPKSPVSKPFVVHNEGRHLWDVSVGVPVTKATALQYAEETSSFTAKEVNRQSIFVLGNIIPFSYSRGWHWGADLSNAKEFRPLVLLAGIGVVGRPGERFFVGGGVGLGVIQAFVGSAFVSTEFRDPVSSIVRKRYSSQLAFGVNIPVLDALKKVGK